MERSSTYGFKCCDWYHFICRDTEGYIRMIELSDTVQELWAEETYRVYQGEPMLSWEACEMIAWNRIAEKIGYENLSRQVS